jgi:hypothetical protein
MVTLAAVLVAERTGAYDRIAAAVIAGDMATANSELDSLKLSPNQWWNCVSKSGGIGRRVRSAMREIEEPEHSAVKSRLLGLYPDVSADAVDRPDVPGRKRSR